MILKNLLNLLPNTLKHIDRNDGYFTDNWLQELPIDEYNGLVEKHVQEFLDTYRLDTVANIMTIPVPKNKETRIPTSVVYMPEQILSRKATEYKKIGNMELAIACLRKANEFRAVSWFSYTAKDYLRLVEFLKQDRRFDEARKEIAFLEKKFPDLFGVTDNSKSYETIKKTKKDITKLEYDWLWEHLEEYCPKSLSSYSRMKNSNSDRFKEIVSKAKEKGFTITIL